MNATVTELRPGDIFAGRYRVVRCMAVGGMGAIYEVVHIETGRRRALKVMLPHVLGSAELRERFRREALVTADIESDFIVDIFDAGVEEVSKTPFLVMELLRGEDLGKRLKRLGPMSPEEAALCLHQAALALDEMHKAHVVHRDLKPENLFLTQRQDGSAAIKVLDFGVAKIIAESSLVDGSTTRSMGTPYYMSPEQLGPDSRVSPASDVYAFGMVAYALLTGRPYWAADLARVGNVFALAKLVERGPVEAASVRAAAEGVTLLPAFDAWFMKVCAKCPRDRFSSATEAAASFAAAFEIQIAPPMSLPPPSIPPTSRRREVDVSSLPTLPDLMAASPAVLTPPRRVRSKRIAALPVVLCFAALLGFFVARTGSSPAAPTSDPGERSPSQRAQGSGEGAPALKDPTGGAPADAVISAGVKANPPELAVAPAAPSSAPAAPSSSGKPVSKPNAKPKERPQPAPEVPLYGRD